MIKRILSRAPIECTVLTHALAASFPPCMPVIKGLAPAARFSAAALIFPASSRASLASSASSVEDSVRPVTSEEVAERVASFREFTSYGEIS